jgi:phosphoenolpyruvate-protein kinase (PTS system EI component)
MKTALIQIDPPKILALHRDPIRVKDGAVTGVVPGTAVVPVVTLDPPVCDYRTHSCQRLDPVAHSDRVEIGWQLVRHTDEQIVSSIKSRAGEIINDRLPQHTQLNMLADAQMIALEPVPTAEQAARLESYRAVYAWIRAVREKSNELEAELIADGTLPDFAELEVPFV